MIFISLETFGRELKEFSWRRIFGGHQFFIEELGDLGGCISLFKDLTMEVCRLVISVLYKRMPFHCKGFHMKISWMFMLCTWVNADNCEDGVHCQGMECRSENIQAHAWKKPNMLKLVSFNVCSLEGPFVLRGWISCILVLICRPMLVIFCYIYLT